MVDWVMLELGLAPRTVPEVVMGAVAIVPALEDVSPDVVSGEVGGAPPAASWFRALMV